MKNRIGQRGKDFVWEALAKIGGPSVVGRWYGGLGSILMFHRIVPHSQRSQLSENQALEISPEQLSRLVQGLREDGYEIVSLDEVRRRFVGGAKRRFVALTFDDGYVDNLELALPVLEKANAPFTVYVATCFPERSIALWWYLFEDVLLARDKIRMSWRDTQLAFDCNSTETKNVAFSDLKAFVLRLDESERDQFVADFAKVHGEDAIAPVKKLGLSWEQVKQLARSPLVTIGAHSLRHLPLSRLGNGEAKHEIEASKHAIENRLQTSVTHFAYPFGSRETAGAREFQFAAEAGFSTAVTTRQGNVTRAHREHPHALPRIEVGAEIAENPDLLRRAMSGWPRFRSKHWNRTVTD